MRIESSVTAISWIPSDAIEGMPKLPFELGVARYDAPPPEHIEEGDLERLRAEDRFREANRLAAYIEVEDGRIVGHGYEGTGLVGSTTFNLGFKDVTIPGVAFEVLRQGLPQEHAYDLVYRHALDVDDSGTLLAFGSTTGSLWVSEDGGDSWASVSTHLPPVYAVQFER
jgi:hypothetical protein